MADARYGSNLRYVPASQLDSRVLQLDGLDVRNNADEHIGDVNGFLVDETTHRPRYLVVDSGGWFRSRHFLLPVGHAQMASNRRALRIDIDRDTIERFPEIDGDRLDAMSDEEYRSYDEGVGRASGRSYDWRSESGAGGPGWWNASGWSATYVAGAPTVSTQGPVGPVGSERIEATRHDVVSDVRHDDAVHRATTSDRDINIRRDGDVRRDATVRRDDARRDRDDEPVLTEEDYANTRPGVRAQPGDVLGIESGGERTGIGDTAKDEDKRREDAEKAARDLREEERKDRR
jgi:hypothetical protein